MTFPICGTRPEVRLFTSRCGRGWGWVLVVAGGAGVFAFAVGRAQQTFSHMSCCLPGSWASASARDLRDSVGPAPRQSSPPVSPCLCSSPSSGRICVYNVSLFLTAEPSRLGVGDSLAHASPLSEPSLYRCKTQLPNWGERVGLLFAPC